MPKLRATIVGAQLSKETKKQSLLSVVCFCGLFLSPVLSP
jgi:hypothetical protein